MKKAVASAGRKSTFIENDYPFLHVTLKDLAKLDSRGSSDKDEKNGEEFYFDSAVLTQVNFIIRLRAMIHVFLTSDHPKNGLVRISNGPFLSQSQMV
jgi:hypothetical protein